MIKKRIAVISGIIIFIVLIVLAVFLLLPRHYEQVFLIEHLRFGMSPAEVQLSFGKPDKVSKSNYSPSYSYTYYTQIGEYQAEVTISFTKVFLHYELTNVYVSFFDIPLDNLDQFYTFLINKYRTDYCDMVGYYEKIDKDKANLGIQKGAIFLDCEIIRYQTGVKVLCSRLY